MPDVRLKFLGPEDRYSEVSVTGQQQVWLKNQSGPVSPGNAALLLATGKFVNAESEGVKTDAGYPVMGREKSLGIVATRCEIPFSSAGGSNKYFMSKSHHKATSEITGLQLFYANWWLTTTAPTGVETNAGSGLFVRCSIEYPLGSGRFYQFLKNGSADHYCVDGGDIETDFLAVKIPKGAYFGVRTWGYSEGANGFPYHVRSGAILSGHQDSCTFGTSPITDTTMGGSVSNTNPAIIVKPTAIVGFTSEQTLAYIADSRGVGTADTIDDGLVGAGNLERRAQMRMGMMKVCASGMRLDQSLTNFSKVLKYIAFGNQVACNLGINDAINGRTAAEIRLDQVSMKALVAPTKPFIGVTMEPHTTGAWTATDGSDQTVTAWSAVRTTINADIRAMRTPFDGFIDVSIGVELPTDATKWNAPAYTADGLHANKKGNLAMRDNGRFPFILG